jgi:hypothetical protein
MISHPIIGTERMNMKLWSKRTYQRSHLKNHYCPFRKEACFGGWKVLLVLLGTLFFFILTINLRKRISKNKLMERRVD